MTKNKENHGLGLSLLKKIVKNHMSVQVRSLLLM